MLVPLPALDFPFDDIAWTLAIPQQKNRSEFTSRTQTIGLPGAEEWRAMAVCLPAASESEARAWRAFLLACRGSENTFHLPALAAPQRLGAQPTVTAAVIGNRAVTVSSAAGIELGMFATVVQADGHHRLVGVVGIDGTNVHFEPYLSAAPLTGQVLEINEPYARMQLSRPDQPLPNVFAPFQFDAEEKL